MKILPEELKKILLQSGFVAERDIDIAIKNAQQINRTLADVLLFRGLISDQALFQLIAEYYHVPYVSLRNKIIDKTILETIPENLARRYKMIPFEKDQTTLKVAMEDPRDFEALEFARRSSHLTVVAYFASVYEITKSFSQYKRNIKEVFEEIITKNTKKVAGMEQSLTLMGQNLPVIKILETILQYAVSENASDIHLEALDDSVIVRFRIDGTLRDIISLPKSIQKAIVARIKILAQLKIDEHRIPQDGRFKLEMDGDLVSIRVSTIPAFYDENIALRILLESNRPLSLEELGLVGKNAKAIFANVKKPYGMILVTGPTGSGKTTTLYSVINILNTPDVNMWTVEDPIEYGIRRVNQTQINPTAGYTFSSGLRALLRHDPNVIMVGEIRDNETADMAIQTALTGHLVLSTLHTNNAAGAIPRFLDMGAEGFLVASTVNVVIAQRLVRKICTVCIEKVNPSQAQTDAFTEKFGQQFAQEEFYKGRGCQDCGGSGYKGRIGIFEVLSMTKAIQDLILKKVSAEDITNTARKEGMTIMLEDGLDKISSGITTIEEVLRVTRE